MASRMTTTAHLPPMTEAEFRDYMAAQDAIVAAAQALYAQGHALGKRAFAAGIDYDDFPEQAGPNDFRRAWQQGWSEAEEAATHQESTR